MTRWPYRLLSKPSCTTMLLLCTSGYTGLSRINVLQSIWPAVKQSQPSSILSRNLHYQRIRVKYTWSPGFTANALSAPGTSYMGRRKEPQYIDIKVSLVLRFVEVIKLRMLILFAKTCEHEVHYPKTHRKYKYMHLPISPYQWSSLLTMYLRLHV